MARPQRCLLRRAGGDNTYHRPDPAGQRRPAGRCLPHGAVPVPVLGLGPGPRSRSSGLGLGPRPRVGGTSDRLGREAEHTATRYPLLRRSLTSLLLRLLTGLLQQQQQLH